MRKILSLLLMVLATLTASAQSYPENGYYRVQNRGNGKRYISLIDNRGSIDYTALNNSDLYASRLRPFEANDKEPGVVNDPGSVFLATQVSTGEYDLASQGSSVSSLVSGIYLHLSPSGNTDFPWIAYGTEKGFTVYICGSSAKGPNGTLYKLGVGNSASGSTFHWAITPVTANGDNYFGLIPDVTAQGAYYKAFYAAFPFKTTGNMKTYYVTKVDKSRGLVVWEEITGTVPRSTPVIVKCAGTEATNNRLDLQKDSPAALSGNQLKGVYFCNNEGDGHDNYVTFDANTMRVLGTCADGSLGYVTPAGLQRIPANSSYLVVGSGAPAELKLVTQKEYEESQAVTITAKSYTRQYGEDNPTFEFTASGTYTGTPEITCEATKTSPVGTYPIVVKVGTVQGQVTAVNGTLTITKAPLTITAKSYTISQTDALPAFEATYSGFKNGETNSVLTTQPTLTSNAPANKAPGTYTITPAGAAATNYDISYVKGTLTINAVPEITITAKDATMVYGDDVPTLLYDVTGGTLTGTPKLVCNATKTSDAGTYDITVDVSGINYPNLKTVPAKLTITQAKLTATASDATRSYGDENPAFTVKYSGWKNDNTEAVLAKKPTAASAATKTTDVGTADITVSGGEAKNYTFDYVKGTLTITKAPVAVKAKSYTIVETEALPPFEAEYSGWKNGQNESVLTKKAALSCNVPAGKTPGSYDITVGGAEATNYSFTYTNGTLTITAAPEITITAKAATMVYGDDVPELTYTVEGGSLSGLPVLSTNATSKSDVGEYDITISKGNIDYPRLKLNGAKLTVTKAMLTVNAGTYTMKQNEQRPAFKATYSGWKNDDTEAVLTKQPTLTTDAPADNTPGEYKVTATGAEAKNYDFAYVEGKLIITAADAITIVATDATMVYGDDVPELEYTINGGTVTGTPVLTCEAMKTSDVGEYVITVEKGSVDYPNIVLVPGKLTITPAKLTVTANDAVREYGEENPALTVTYSGWKNDDTEAVLTQPATATTVATVVSDAGTADIIAAGAEAKNYTFDYVKGTLTIDKAVLTVTAENATREEGQPNPEFTLTYSGWKNGDTESVLTEQPVATTEADETSLPGDYDIVVSGGEAKNYTFVYVNGTLTVTKEDAIASLIAQGKAFDVYTTTGVKVRSNATSLKGLPRGIYMINGKKVLVK